MTRSEMVTIQAAKSMSMLMQAETEYMKSKSTEDFDSAADSAISACAEFAKAIQMFVNDYPYSEELFDSVRRIKGEIEHLKNIRKV